MSRLFAAGRIPARRSTPLFRAAALRTGHDERVRVLFAEMDGNRVVYRYGLEMDRDTYHAIPLGVPATPDTFRAIAAEHGHRSVLECRADFDDLYTPA